MILDLYGKGLDCYKNGKYEEAVEHFGKALFFLFPLFLFLQPTYSSQDSIFLNFAKVIFVYASISNKSNIKKI
jgi:hypothetical protein